MNYAERTNHEVFKPLIDEVLMKLANWAETDVDELYKILDDIDASRLSAWEYLRAAIAETGHLIFTEAVREHLGEKWEVQLFDPSTYTQYHFYAGAIEDDYEVGQEIYDPNANPIVLAYYPDEAHEALRQEDYWGGAGSDVLGIWTTDKGVQRVYHAHIVHFKILGEDPIDYMNRILHEDFNIW